MLGGFGQIRRLTAAEEGWRIVIVDGAEGAPQSMPLCG
jgi:hypothetical protein